MKEKHFLDFSQKEGFIDDPTTSHSEQLEALEVVFNTAAEADTPTEVCTCIFVFIFINTSLAVPGKIAMFINHTEWLVESIGARLFML